MIFYREEGSRYLDETLHQPDSSSSTHPPLYTGANRGWQKKLLIFMNVYILSLEYVVAFDCYLTLNPQPDALCGWRPEASGDFTSVTRSWRRGWARCRPILWTPYLTSDSVSEMSVKSTRNPVPGSLRLTNVHARFQGPGIKHAVSRCNLFTLPLRQWTLSCSLGSPRIRSQSYCVEEEPCQSSINWGRCHIVIRAANDRNVSTSTYVIAVCMYGIRSAQCRQKLRLSYRRHRLPCIGHTLTF